MYSATVPTRYTIRLTDSQIRFPGSIENHKNCNKLQLAKVVKGFELEKASLQWKFCFLGHAVLAPVKRKYIFIL